MAAKVVGLPLQLPDQSRHVRVGDAVRGLTVDVETEVVVRHDEHRDVGQRAEVHEALEGAAVGDRAVVEDVPDQRLDEGGAQVDAGEEDEAADVAVLADVGILRVSDDAAGVGGGQVLHATNLEYEDDEEDLKGGGGLAQRLKLVPLVGDEVRPPGGDGGAPDPLSVGRPLRSRRRCRGGALRPWRDCDGPRPLPIEKKDVHVHLADHKVSDVYDLHATYEYDDQYD